MREIELCDGVAFALPAWSTTDSELIPTAIVLPLAQPLSVIV